MTGPLAVALVDRLVARFGKTEAHKRLDAILDQVPPFDLACLRFDWNSFWAREKQIIPDTDWRSFGFLTARGTGKTTSCTHFILGEIQAGRAMEIGCAAQKEEKTFAVQIKGLIDASPPWFKPTWHGLTKTLVWDNGATAYAFTPEVPEAIRSPNLHLAWLSELQSWPAATREEAFSNFQFATRVGYARTLWDATPKRGHPILKKLRSRSSEDPARHVIVGGNIRENRRNLAPGVIEDMEKDWAGTSKGREELEGETLDDVEGALFEQAWIERTRRARPERLVSKILSIDPATTGRKGSDITGIILAGLGVDGQALVLGDRSKKMSPSVWVDIVVDWYVKEHVDYVVVETNKGGDLLYTALRAVAQLKGLEVVVVGKDERPKHRPGVILLKEVYAQGAKEDRAQPVAVVYERQRVSHVKDAVLDTLEETLTTWVPSPYAKSPGDLDALVHAIVELLELKEREPDPKKSFKGLEKAQRVLVAPYRPPTI